MKTINMRKFRLYKIQKTHFKAVLWLLNNEDGGLEDMQDRRSGRTTLMAYTFITLALKNPGRAIHVYDHYPLQKIIFKILMPQILAIWEKICPSEIQKSLKINIYDFTICFKP